MKRNLKWSLLVFCICLTVLFVTACGGSGNNSTNNVNNTSGTNNSENTPEEPVMSDVTLSVMSSQDQIMDAEIELAKTFEEETGIKVDYQIVPSDQFPNLLSAKLNSGEGPDIIVTQGGKLTLKSTLDPEKNLEDLSAEPWVTGIKKPFEEGVSYNGKLYGLPLWDLSTGGWVLVYNKQIFADHGLKPPTTFDELLNVSQTLLDNGITPIYEAGSDGWHHQLPLLEMGPRVAEMNEGFYEQLNQNETTFAENADMLKLVEQIAELVEKGYYGEEYFNNTVADMYNAMGTGKYAMIIDGSNFGTKFVGENVSDSPYGAEDFSAVVMPFLDNQILNVNPQGPSKFVYKDGEHVAEAKQFLEYLTRPENLKYFLDNTERFSDLTFEGVTPKANQVLEEISAGISKEGTVLQAGVTYVDPQWMDIGQDLMSVFTGNLKPIEVLEKMDKRRNEQATAQKDPAWSK